MLRSGSTSHGERSPPSHVEGVALLVARTCNEVVPAHKEFLCARQIPVPLICTQVVCWVLEFTVPGSRYAAPGTRGSRLEYVQRVLVSYNTAAACCCTYIVVAHTPVSLPYSGGVACRTFLTSIANSPKSWWEGNLVFCAEGRYIFKNVLSQTL